MPYELRLDSNTVLTFDSEEEAMARVREEMLARPDLEPELLDTATGKPVTPAASKADRDDLSNKVGY